jgi:hypothetical protein
MMDKVQKHNSFNTNTPSSESYRNHLYPAIGYGVASTSERCDSIVGFGEDSGLGNMAPNTFKMHDQVSRKLTTW